MSSITDGTRRGGTQIVLLICAVLTTGTLGYYFIEESWSLMDAFYMTVITITTIGYGEVHELSPRGRLFTVLLIIFGLGVSAIFAAHFARLLLESALKGTWGKRKMAKKIANLENHYIVCGFGEIGRAICAELHDRGLHFVVIDGSEENAELAEQRRYLVLRGNATTDLALLSAGIKKAAGLVAALSSDSDNLYISLMAREFNPGLYIVVRGEGEGVEQRMHRAGADIVVSPMKLGGRQIAQMIAEQAGGSSLSKGEETISSVLGFHLKVFKNLTGSAVTVAHALKTTGASKALALKRADGNLFNDPPPNEGIAPNEAVVLLLNEGERPGDTEKAPEVEASLDSSLSVGIMSIDEEHQLILGLIGKLKKSSATSDREVIDTVLSELVDYTVTHFRHEEELLEKHGYPELEAHRKEHMELSGKVLDLQKEKHYLFKENFSDLLNEWLRHHILGTDKKYADFLISRGVK